MGFVFLTLALGLAFVAWKLDRDDVAMRWTIFGGAALNGIAFLVMLASSDPWAWSLRPALAMSWW